MTTIQEIQEKAQQLERTLGIFRAQFDSWTKHSVIQLQQKEAQHQEFVLHSDGVANSLLEKERKSVFEATKLRQELERESNQESTLTNRLHQLRVQEREVPDRLAQLQKELETAKQQIDVNQHALMEKEKSKKQLLNNLTRGIALYKERLGLEFHRKGANHIRFSFRFLDRADDNKEFSFSICITDTDQYELVECQPVLPASVVSGTVTALNNSNNFGRFVAQMRKHFKTTLQRQ